MENRKAYIPAAEGHTEGTGIHYAASDRYAAGRDAAVPANVRREPLAERLPYPGGFPVYLARYVLFGGEEPRVAMRFFNASGILVTGLRLRVTEKDKDGNTIAEYPLERQGLFAERGTEFAVKDAPISYACTSVEVQVQAVISDGYEYISEENGVRLNYGLSPRERELYFKKNATYSVSKRRKRYIFIAFAAVLGAVLLTMCLAWRLGVFKEFGVDGSLGRTEITESV